MTTLETAPAVSLWHDRRFLRFWTGQAISQLGDQVTVLALPLIAVGLLHATATQVAWLTALTWLPNLLATVLGAWIDQRTHKLRLMIIADVVSAGVLLTVPLAYAFDAITLTQLFTTALLIGACAVVFNTAYPPFFAHLVPRASYLDANSKLSTTQAGAYVAGPALAGVLVQSLSAPVALTADALSFVVAVLLFRRARTHEPPVSQEGAAPLLMLAKEGLAFIGHHPVLRASLGCSAMVNFFTFVSGSGLIVLFATRTLGLTAATIGLAFGLGATGSILGAIIAPAVSRWFGLGRTIAIGAVLFPAPIALTAVAAGPEWLRAGALAATEFLGGIGVMFFDVNLVSLKTSIVPDGMRSRVAGAYSTINYGIRPLGAVVGGLLASTIGLRPTLMVAAIGGVMCVLWLVPSPIPRIRSLAEITGPHQAGSGSRPGG